MEIREAIEADREAIYDVHIASIHGVEPGGYSDQELQTWAKKISTDLYALEQSDVIFLVAEEDSTVLGFIEVLINDQTLDKLYVREQHQGQGIARALLEEAELHVRNRGCGMIEVESSLNAASFYEHVGFTQIGRSETSTGLSTVLLKKQLR